MILSLHYRKTAGTSFRHTLTKLYYGHIYFHYHGAQLSKSIRAKGHRDDIKIIHGHFSIKPYRDMFPDAPIITWLRDPAERVLSYYNYEKYFNTSFNQSGKTIPSNRKFEIFLESEQFNFFANQFERYIGDYTIKDFLFIGIVDRYNEDMKKLAGLLGWRGYQVHYLNKSRNYENIVLTDDIRQRIYKRMAREYDMYKEVRG